MDDRFAIDIGSTIIKVARIDDSGGLLSQDFIDRDFKLGINAQVGAIIDDIGNGNQLLVCSSANGGLSVGLVCLSLHFSGSVLRNQVLLAGANPVYLLDFENLDGDLRKVDILLLGGGIDCEEAAPLADRLDRFDESKFRYTVLVYAGNRYLAAKVRERFSGAVVVDNPLAGDLRGRSPFVWQCLRDVYLDDLIHKDGVSELQERIAHPIHPTPEVVSRGFHRLVSNHSSINVLGSCILLDIGGATTDIHYTIEIIRDDCEEQANIGSSVARYVFTDLGVFSSRESTTHQLRNHPRLYDFLARVLDGDIQETYRLMREGDYEPAQPMLCCACAFLALERLTLGSERGLPAVDLNMVSEIVLTGGAPHTVDEQTVTRLASLFLSDPRNQPKIIIDRDYRIWAEGMTWPTSLPRAD